MKRFIPLFVALSVLVSSCDGPKQRRAEKARQEAEAAREDAERIAKETAARVRERQEAKRSIQDIESRLHVTVDDIENTRTVSGLAEATWMTVMARRGWVLNLSVDVSEPIPSLFLEGVTARDRLISWDRIIFNIDGQVSTMHMSAGQATALYGKIIETRILSVSQHDYSVLRRATAGEVVKLRFRGSGGAMDGELTQPEKRRLGEMLEYYRLHRIINNRSTAGW